MLLMVGRPGAGKTFFARQFGETFRAPVVSYERIRYELFNEPTFTKEEQEIIDRVAAYQIAELLKTQQTFIIDGGSNTRNERQRFATLARPANYNTLAVWVQTDEATARQRAIKRNEHRLDDQFVPSLTTEVFDRLSKQLADPLREPYVVISGKHTYTTQARAVLRRLAEGHQTTSNQVHQAATAETSRPRAPGPRNIVIR